MTGNTGSLPIWKNVLAPFKAFAAFGFLPFSEPDNPISFSVAPPWFAMNLLEIRSTSARSRSTKASACVSIPAKRPISTACSQISSKDFGVLKSFTSMPRSLNRSCTCAWVNTMQNTMSGRNARIFSRFTSNTLPTISLEFPSCGSGQKDVRPTMQESAPICCRLYVMDGDKDTIRMAEDAKGSPKPKISRRKRIAKVFFILSRF